MKVRAIQGYPGYYYSAETNQVISTRVSATAPRVLTFSKNGNSEPKVTLQRNGYPYTFTMNEIKRYATGSLVTLSHSDKLIGNKFVAAATATPAGNTPKGSIVGSFANGSLSFSTNPKVHANETLAKAEAERLAQQNPGKLFIVATLSGAVRAGGVNWLN